MGYEPTRSLRRRHLALANFWRTQSSRMVKSRPHDAIHNPIAGRAIGPWLAERVARQFQRRLTATDLVDVA